MRRLFEVEPSTCISPNHPGMHLDARTGARIPWEEVDHTPGEYTRECPDCGKWIYLICQGYTTGDGPTIV